MESDADTLRGLLTNVGACVRDVGHAIVTFRMTIHPSILQEGTENAWECISAASDDDMYDVAAHNNVQACNNVLMRASLHMFNLFEEGLDYNIAKGGSKYGCGEEEYGAVMHALAHTQAECVHAMACFEQVPEVIQGMSSLPFVKENVARVQNVLNVLREEIVADVRSAEHNRRSSNGICSASTGEHEYGCTKQGRKG
jgi:hypothetical protein